MATSSRYSWRVVDLITLVVLAIVSGLIFKLGNITWYPALKFIGGLGPGFDGLYSGFWLIGGVLGGLVIRKPGAAFLCEFLAAVGEVLLAGQFGVGTLYSGVAQGLGAEIAFAIFAYHRFDIWIASLAGALSGVAAVVNELFLYSNLVKGWGWNIGYLICFALSGAIMAGVIGWLIVRALAQTGALDRFEAGREVRQVG